MFYTHLSKNSSIILNALKSNGLLSLDSMQKTDYQEYGNNQQFHFHKSAVCLLNFRRREYFSLGLEPKKTLFPILMHEHVHRHIKAEMHLFSEFSVYSNGHVLLQIRNRKSLDF